MVDGPGKRKSNHPSRLCRVIGVSKTETGFLTHASRRSAGRQRSSMSRRGIGWCIPAGSTTPSRLRRGRKRPMTRLRCRLTPPHAWSFAHAEPASLLHLPRLTSDRLVYGLKAVSQPDLAPDYRQVVHVVSGQDRETGKGVSQIWLASVDGASQRQLTWNEGSHSSPVWSPDGRSIRSSVRRSMARSKAWEIRMAFSCW